MFSKFWLHFCRALKSFCFHGAAHCCSDPAKPLIPWLFYVIQSREAFFSLFFLEAGIMQNQAWRLQTKLVGSLEIEFLWSGNPGIGRPGLAIQLCIFWCGEISYFVRDGFEVLVLMKSVIKFSLSSVRPRLNKQINKTTPELEVINVYA